MGEGDEVGVAQRLYRVGHRRDAAAGPLARLEVAQSLQKHILALSGEARGRLLPGEVVLVAGTAAVLFGERLTRLGEIGLGVGALGRRRRRERGEIGAEAAD